MHNWVTNGRRRCDLMGIDGGKKWVESREVL